MFLFSVGVEPGSPRQPGGAEPADTFHRGLVDPGDLHRLGATADSVDTGGVAGHVVTGDKKAVAESSVVICMTYLSLVVGELVPKRLVLHSSEIIARLHE